MKCTYCGAELPANAKHCPNCGNAVAAMMQENEKQLQMGYGEQQMNGQSQQWYGEQQMNGQPQQWYGEQQMNGQSQQMYGQPQQWYGEQQMYGQPQQGYGNQQMYMQPQQEPYKRKFNLVCILANIFYLISPFLLFIKMEYEGESETITLMEDSDISALGVLCIIFAVWGLIFCLCKKKIPVIIGGVLAFLWAAFLMVGVYLVVYDEIGDADLVSEFISYGAGAWMMLISSLVIIISASAYRTKAKQ